MSNWSELKKESALTAALVVLCQDYVMYDEEFLENKNIKKCMSKASFWIELAKELRGTIESNFATEQEGYDDVDSISVSESQVLSYVLDPENRFAINDMICETIESWLKHFGRN